MADLNAIAKRIITVNRVTALLMPRDLRRVRSPVIFFAVEFSQDRRIDRRVDTKIDMRPFDRARAALGDLIDATQDYQLPRVRHGQRYLLVARNLLFFR